MMLLAAATATPVTHAWSPTIAIVMSGLFWLLVIEAVRRTGGLPIAIIIIIVSLYPVFADKMPGPIAGLPQSLPDTIAYHVLSAESAFGIPMRAFGELVVGFIVFGVALNHTGGGKFFNDVAFALVGLGASGIVVEDPDVVGKSWPDFWSMIEGLR